MQGTTVSVDQARGVYRGRIATGLVGSIQSEDTVYLHGITGSVAGAAVIGSLLTLLAVVCLLPAAFVLTRVARGRPVWARPATARRRARRGAWP